DGEQVDEDAQDDEHRQHADGAHQPLQHDAPMCGERGFFGCGHGDVPSRLVVHSAAMSERSTPVASAMMFSWVMAKPVSPPTSPAISPSRMTRTRSAMPTISGSSEEMTRMPTPVFANWSMMR